MKKLTAFVAGSVFVLSSAAAFAGGPVIVEEEAEPVVVAPVGSGLNGGLVAAGVALLAIAALASGGDSGSHDSNSDLN